MAVIGLHCFEALGPRYIAAAARTAGYECLEIYYEDLKRNSFRYPEPHELDGLMGLLRESELDFVGLSVRSSYRKLAAMLTERIQKDLGLPVIWGSVHPSVAPQDSLEVADAVCVGDGEIAIVELLSRIEKGMDTTNISGIWVKDRNGTVTGNGYAQYVDVNSIANPSINASGKFYTIDGKVYAGDPTMNDVLLSIVSARGCPHACSYCSNSFFKDASRGYLRIRDVDNVIAEIKSVMEHKPLRRVKFVDDLFAVNRKWTDEFVEKYRKEIGVPFDALLHHKHINEEVMAKLVSAGLYLIDTGIQSGSEKVRTNFYNRSLSNERMLEAMKIINRYNVQANYSLIVDNPLETSDDKRESFEFLFQIPRPYTVFIYSLINLPGVPLTKRLLEEGHITEDDVEGRSDKSLFQWEVSLYYNRSKEDSFWLSLISLLPKSFVPKSLIWVLSRSKFLMRHPEPLVALAWVANLVKLGFFFLTRVRQGQATKNEIRRHVHLKNLSIR